MFVPNTIEYTLYAFRSTKGVYTLVGTSNDWLDTFKCIETGEYHEWNRSQVYEWFVNGKISAVSDSNTIDWHTNPAKINNRLQSLKSSRKK